MKSDSSNATFWVLRNVVPPKNFKYLLKRFVFSYSGGVQVFMHTIRLANNLMDSSWLGFAWKFRNPLCDPDSHKFSRLTHSWVIFRPGWGLLLTLRNVVSRSKKKVWGVGLQNKCGRSNQKNKDPD